MSKVSPSAVAGTDAHRFRRLPLRDVALFAMLIVLVSCGVLPLVTSERSGPCTLNLLDASGERLTEPYSVTMRHQPGGPPVADILYEADGWGATTIWTTSPTGVVTQVSVDADGLNSESIGGQFDTAGAWHERFSSGDCVHEFDITVAPP